MTVPNLRHSNNAFENGIESRHGVGSKRIGAVDAVAQAAFNEKKWVWVQDEKEGYLAGWITKETTDKRVEVRINNGADVRPVDSNELSKMNPPKFDYAEDVADLTHLNDATVIHNLRLRYHSNMIYTYSGLFLVAINPYRPLPIYTDSVIAAYKHKKRHEAAPHIYAVADASYNDMLVEHENQSILITGESGAGKTENTKKVIQYLAAIASDVKSVKQLGQLEQQILQANPILESFGNAQTIRNNNSSRFGKFVRIQFNRTGQIAGANIDWYLLEKSRVVHQSPKERNYHIFYQLMKGGDRHVKSQFLLDGSLSDYKYLKGSRKDIDGVDDVAEFKALRDALDVVGFEPHEQNNLFRVIAAILHIGNLEISADREDQALLPNVSLAERVCHVLGIPVNEFVKSLLRPRVKAGRELVTQHRTKSQVVHSMEALAKTLYERSFGRLVERINEALERSTNKSTFIGVLDIAGFEIFELNSFEQLNINYTNEKLQQFFNHHMFVLEQEEYARENIDWTYHDFGQDLRPTIDLIELSNPIGILSCLDEECVMPKASNKTFIDKLNGLWAGKSDKYEARKFEQGFKLQHYAGQVEYDTDGWLEKNKDPLNDNVSKLLAESSDPYIAALFSDFAEEDNSAAARYAQANGLTASRPKSRVKKGAFRTVAQRHKEQLSLLMQQLSRTQPHFVRCIIPNQEKKPGKIDNLLVLEQLRCNGVLEGIRIARKGYPNRLPFAEFRARYEVLCGDIIPQGFMDGRQASQKMLAYLKIDTKLYQIGTSKVFFKAGVLADLEEKRDECLSGIMSRFEGMIRGYVTRRRARKQLFRQQAVRIIQRNARAYIDLKQWEWWQLYTKVKPLLNATRVEESIRTRETKIAKLQQQIRNEEEERELLRHKQASLEQDRAKIEEELAQERQTAQDKEEILKRTLERCAALMEELHESAEERNDMEHQLETALSSVAAHRQQSAELQEALTMMQDALPKVERDRTAFKEREAELIRQQEDIKSHLTKQLASLRSEFDKVQVAAQKDANELREAHEKAKKQVEAQQGVESRLTKKLSSLQSEFDKLQVKAQSDANELRAARDNAKKQVEMQQGIESHLTKKLSSLQSEFDKLQVKAQSDAIELCEARDKVKKQVEAQQGIESRFTKKLSSLQSEFDKLQIKAQSDANELREAREAKKQAETQQGIESRLTQKLASLQSEFDKLQVTAQSDANELRAARDNAKKQVETYKQTMSKLSAEARALRSAEQEAQAAATTAERVRVKAESELQTIRSRHMNAEGIADVARREVEKLHKLLETANMKTEISEDKLAKAERNNASLQRQVDALRKQYDAELEERKVSSQWKQNLQSQLSAALAKVEEAESAHAALRKESSSHLSKLSDFKVRSEKERSTLLVTHEDTRKRLERELAEAATTVAALTKDRGDLAEIKKRLDAELEDMKRQFEAQIKELERKVADAEHACKTAEVAKRTLEEELLRSHNDLETDYAERLSQHEKSKLALVQELEASNETLSKELASKAEIIKANRQLRQEIDKILASRVESDGAEEARRRRIEAELSLRLESEATARRNFEQFAERNEKRALEAEAELDKIEQLIMKRKYVYPQREVYTSL